MVLFSGIIHKLKRAICYHVNMTQKAKFWLWSTIIVIVAILIGIAIWRGEVQPAQTGQSSAPSTPALSFSDAGITPDLLMGRSIGEVQPENLGQDASGTIRAAVDFETTSTLLQVWQYYTDYFKKNNWVAGLAADVEQPTKSANQIGLSFWEYDGGTIQNVLIYTSRNSSTGGSSVKVTSIISQSSPYVIQAKK